jgi:hypothetical protein
MNATQYIINRWSNVVTGVSEDLCNFYKGRRAVGQVGEKRNSRC